jgi:hypothetical protein
MAPRATSCSGGLPNHAASAPAEIRTRWDVRPHLGSDAAGARRLAIYAEGWSPEVSAARLTDRPDHHRPLGRRRAAGSVVRRQGGQGVQYDLRVPAREPDRRQCAVGRIPRRR